jgi:hypothetical protein
MPQLSAIGEPAINQCVRVMLRLHDLDVQGKGHCAEAARVSAEMEIPWSEMTAQEQERLGGLSEDLYALAEKKGPSVNVSADEAAQWRQSLGNAYRAHNWDGLLLLLRQAPRAVPAPVISFLQARAWENLGHLDVAVRFMERAAELDPDDRILVLAYLQKFGREAEATACASEILQEDEYERGWPLDRFRVGPVQRSG